MHLSSCIVQSCKSLRDYVTILVYYKGVLVMAERIFIDNGLLSLLCNDTQGNLWDSFLDVAASMVSY